MSPEVAQLQHDLQSLRRELEQARREFALIRPHLFPDDGTLVGSTPTGSNGVTATITGKVLGHPGKYTGSGGDIWNEPEIVLNPTAHLLDATTSETYIGWQDPASGVTHISPFPVGATASPATVGSNTSTSETADTATWSRTSDAKAVDVWVTCRVAYNNAGDKKLYEFRRKFSYDACGLLIAISAETRVVVDTAEACS